MAVRPVQTNAEAAPPPPPKPLAAARRRLRSQAAKAGAKKARQTRLSKQVNWKGEPRQRKAKAKPRSPKERLQVHLLRRHVLGPKVYGPGVVVVDEAIGRDLQAAESRANQEEARLHQDRAFVVGGGNRVIEVDPSHFDMTMGGMLPHSRVGG